MITNLATDTLFDIIKYIDPIEQIKTCSIVCTRWHKLIKSDRISVPCKNFSDFIINDKVHHTPFYINYLINNYKIISCTRRHLCDSCKLYCIDTNYTLINIIKILCNAHEQSSILKVLNGFDIDFKIVRINNLIYNIRGSISYNFKLDITDVLIWLIYYDHVDLIIFLMNKYYQNVKHAFVYDNFDTSDSESSFTHSENLTDSYETINYFPNNNTNVCEWSNTDINIGKLIYVAVIHKKISIIKYLMTNNIGGYYSSNFFGTSYHDKCLEHAIYDSDIELTDLLINDKTDESFINKIFIDINYFVKPKNKYSCPNNICVPKITIKMIKYLQLKNYIINYDSILCMGIYHENFDIINYSLDNDADCICLNYLPACIAVSNNNIMLLKYILNLKQITPTNIIINCAITNNHFDIIEYLYNIKLYSNISKCLVHSIKNHNLHLFKYFYPKIDTFVYKKYSMIDIIIYEDALEIFDYVYSEKQMGLTECDKYLNYMNVADDQLYHIFGSPSIFNFLIKKRFEYLPTNYDIILDVTNKCSKCFVTLLVELGTYDIITNDEILITAIKNNHLSIVKRYYDNKYDININMLKIATGSSNIILKYLKKKLA